MKKGISTIIIILIVVIAGGAFFSVISRQQSMNEQIEPALSEKPCDTSKKPFEFNAKPYHTTPPPDTYLVKVYVETTSLWTNVEAVEGIQSITVSDYILLEGAGPGINVQVEGLIYNELSRPETDRDVHPKIAVEFEAIVQKEGDTAVFRIRKGNSGTTLYKLYSVMDNATREVARFVHDGIVQEGDNVRTFIFDLDLLSSPLALPSAEKRYDGPLFDAHLHLVGTDSEDMTRAKDDKLFINPENADEFFAMLDTEGVIGLIGFLPVIHEYFVADDYFNKPFHQKTLSVLNKCNNKIIPFQYPYSHIGIPPKKYSQKLPTLIDQNYPILFRGIGELHTGYPQTDSYADMRLIDPAMLLLYDYAAKNNLIVMIHPEVTNLEDLRGALAHNRKTLFLLHGDEGVEKLIPTLFKEYDNLYYSLDAGLLYPYGIAMAGMTKEEFMNNLHSNKMYYRLLASALHYWKPLIEAYPDRVMWGTDALYSWHFEHEVYSELTWFARDFIGGLSPEVQEGFGYKNAERLLRRR